MTGRFPAVVFVVAGLFAVSIAYGSCLPLASQNLWPLDAQAETQPEQAIRDAKRRIAGATGPSNAYLRAQLYAVVGDAFIELSQPDESKAAINSARAELRVVPGSDDVSRLTLRLDLLDAQLLIVASNTPEAVAAATQLLAKLPGDSLERACTLSVRAIAYDYLRKPDLSVGDALNAYRIAQGGQWMNAKLEAAGTLARMFARAGLYPQAERMANEVVAIAKSDNRTALLSTAEYERGMLLVRAGRFSEARSALESSKAHAIMIGDRFAVAAANANLCWATLREGDLDAADRFCQGGDEDMATGHRDDLAAQLIGNRAHLDLERRRPEAALKKLNQILTPALHAMLPGSETQFYWDRARALRALNRTAEANADLVRMHELEEAADNAQRNRQVAVLSALIASEELTTKNRQLRERLEQQQREATRQRERRTTLSVATLIVAALLGYLLWISRRHSRALRRQEIILKSTGHNAPDGFLIFDEQRRVTFANRNLCGSGPPPVVGEPVSSSLPASLVPTMTAAIDEAFARRTVNCVTVSMPDADGSLRTFEIYVVPAVELERVVGGTVRATDVTDHQALERQVLDSESQERQRLSNELHEGVGQQLAGVMLLLGNASAAVRRGQPQAGELIDETARYVQETIEAMRELARGLAPVKIGMGSLTVALDSLVADAVRRHAITVHCNCRLEGTELTELAADHLYSICRDAVTNASLHGRRTNVAIGIKVTGNVLTVSIADDGTPAPPAGDYSRSLAIKMIVYRTRLLGGDCRVTALAAGGTSLTAEIPLQGVTTSSKRRGDQPPREAIRPCR